MSVELSQVESAREDGHVVFEDGCLVHVDVVMHCTGYALLTFVEECNSYKIFNFVCGMA